MSTHPVRCPACDGRFALTAEQLGRTIRCGSCRHTFTAPTADQIRPEAPPAPPPEGGPPDPTADPKAGTYRMSAGRAGARASGRVSETDLDDLASKPAPARPRRTREPGRRFRRDPSRTGKAGLIGLIAAGVIVLGVIAGGVYFVVQGVNQAARLKFPDAAQRGPNDPGPPPAAPNPFPRLNPGPVDPADLKPPPVGDPPEPVRDPPPPQPGPGRGRRSAPAPEAPPAPKRRPIQLPAVRPVAITPAALAAERVEVKLPAPAADVCAAGGGRYLVFHLPQPKQLAVFDVSAAKVVKYLPLTADDAQIAGGMNKLFVALPETTAVARYDLETFEKEVTAPLVVEGKLARIAVGSASAGPLVVCTGDSSRGGKIDGLYDPVSFRKFDVEWDKGAGWPTLTPAFLRASADGTAFAFHDGFGGEPHALKTMALAGSRAQGGGVWPAGASIGVPGPDGKLLYCANGVFSPLDMKKVLPKDAGGGSYLPSTDPALFLRLEPGANGKAGRLTVHTTGDDRPLAQLAGIDAVKAEEVGYGTARDPFHHDKRIHFVPQANLIVTVPPGNDRLVLHRFDLDAALDKSGIDYLFVTSRPPAAGPGAKFEYRIKVKSKKGGVKFKLDAGPDGMTVSPGGLVTWSVPAGFSGPAAVIITVSDKTGQETFHSFTLSVSAKGDGS
jgi:predicted Zn finger-like uncharacterized protein